MKFYSQRFIEEGVSINSVGWKNEETQLLRFSKLLQDIDIENKTILDIGCGLGDLIPFLKLKCKTFNYIGIDICHEFIEHCKKTYINDKNCSFLVVDPIEFCNSQQYDFDIAIASGTFTYKTSNTEDYTNSALTRIIETTKLSFCFNMLSNSVDYTLEKNTHYDKDIIGEFVASFTDRYRILDDYPLYEFTVQIHKGDTQ